MDKKEIEKVINKEEPKQKEFINLDDDILDIIAGQNAYESITDPIKRARVVINFLGEFLALMKKTEKQVLEISRAFTICSYDKQLDFFVKVKENKEKEDNKQKAKAIISQSHKKPTK